MRTLKILFVLLGLGLWQMATAQTVGQTVTRKFVNTQDIPIVLYVSSVAENGVETIKQTVDLGQNNGSFRKIQVQVGDQVWAQAKNDQTFRTDVIHINGSRTENEPIEFSPQVPFIDFLGKLGNNGQSTRFLGIAYNLYGVHITNYHPRKVINSFTGNQIFRGMGNELKPSATRSYFLQGGTGVILPYGFEYTGFDDEQQGGFDTQEYFTHESFKKAWNLSGGVSGKVKNVSGGIDFSYGEEFEKSNKQAYMYYLKEQTNNAYSIGMDLNTVEFDPKFLADVVKIKTQQDANAFVQKYGSHYPKWIMYGARFSQYTSMNKSEYFEAKRKNLSVALKVGVDKSTPGRKVINKSPSTNVERDEPGKDKAVSGNVGFSLSESREVKEILSRTKSRYYAIGGTINPDQAWSLEGTKTAIDIELGEISELIDAHILKSKITPKQLQGVRELVQNAVDAEKAKLKPYQDRKERAFQVQVKDIKITDHIDDAQKAGKGFIKTKVVGTNEVVTLFEVSDWWGGFNNDWKIHFQNPQEENPSSRSWYTFVQVADANGNFPPFKLDFAAQLWDRDDCCGDELAELKWGEQPTRNLNTNDMLIHTMRFKDNDHLVLQDWGVEVKVAVRTMPRELFSSTRSATVSSSTPRPRVAKYQPPTVSAAQFGKLAQSDGSGGTTATTTTPATTTTTTPKEVNGRNTSKVMFDGGSFVQQPGTKTWNEVGSDGQAKFSFEEVKRDEWSVYLHDKKRNIYIALDLWKKQVKYKDANNPNYSNLYKITDAQ